HGMEIKLIWEYFDQLVLATAKPLLRSQQIFEVRLQVERSKIAELFARADESRGDTKLILDCSRSLRSLSKTACEKFHPGLLCRSTPGVMSSRACDVSRA